VPKDLKLDGPKETVKITVTYDTKSLFGKIVATREIAICAE
jgi:hypothetical protein